MGSFECAFELFYGNDTFSIIEFGAHLILLLFSIFFDAVGSPLKWIFFYTRRFRRPTSLRRSSPILLVGSATLPHSLLASVPGLFLCHCLVCIQYRVVYTGLRVIADGLRVRLPN
jgi:hypothetical protein